MTPISQVNVAGKKVLVRLDLDVPVSNGQVGDLTRLKAALPTLNYLLQNQATVIIVSHAGRPDGQVVESMSLRPMLAKLVELLGGQYTYQIIDRPLPPLEGTIFALENLRFDSREEQNDLQFAHYLASFADLYVNDSFAVSHRAHASLEAITKCLPSYAGLHLLEEVENLTKAMSNPVHPVVLVLGGAKVETKLPAITNMAGIADHILLGGKLVLETDGLDLPPQVVLPTDMQTDNLDIGPQSAKAYAALIAQAKTIIWNGPMGKFEQPPYDQSTRIIAQAIVDNHSANRIIGGGDTLAALEAFGLLDQAGYISTGGGAMLDFLANKPLPALEALNKQSLANS